MAYRVVMIDGHNAPGRLSAALLDAYAAGLPAGTEIERFCVPEMDFEPDLKGGYTVLIDWEPDLLRLAEAIDACDHLVIAFPMWWGAEPARTKGLIDRLLLPGYAFAYHQDDPWWDRLLEGRSADLIVTMDTPPLFLRLAYGDAVIRRWRGQILGFTGFAPVRVFRFGPVRKGGAARTFDKWTAKLRKAAAGSAALKRKPKRDQAPARERRARRRS